MGRLIRVSLAAGEHARGIVAENPLDALRQDVDWEILIATGERDYKATISKKQLSGTP